MNRSEIPISVNLGKNNSISFGEINRRFHQSEHGQRLAQKIRYQRYNLDDESHKKLSNDEWIKLLGADVDNYKHLPLTHGLAQVFIEYSGNEYSKDEQENLLLAAIIHDWGEAKTGDVTHDDKNDTREKEEMIALRHMASNIFGDNPALCNRINFVVDSVLKDTSSRLGQAFNVIERLGYLRTGLRSWIEIQYLADDDNHKDGLYWLTNNVLLNQIPTLIEYSEIYPPVKIYLENSQDLITSAFNNLPKSMFDNYAKEEVLKRKTMYASAKHKWQEYCHYMS
jgi:hypothetical protein